jgi:glucose/arabinose dehydrogenase
MRRILIAAMTVMALAGCGRKDAQQQAQQQQQDSPFVADNAQPQQQPRPSGGSGLFSSSCPTLPSRDAVAKGIKDALNAIYGPDEAGAKVSVSTMTPAGDCKTVAVAYKSSGTPGSTTMSHDGDKWSLTLYNKQYPVQ